MEIVGVMPQYPAFTVILNAVKKSYAVAAADGCFLRAALI